MQPASTGSPLTAPDLKRAGSPGLTNVEAKVSKAVEPKLEQGRSAPILARGSLLSGRNSLLEN